MKYRYKINLVGLNDCKGLVEALDIANKKAILTDGNNYYVSAKSLLGALASLEWDSLYIESEEDIYNIIEQWT